ncbi:(2R)-sulfolactate sulfo-lyase subunit alpha/altronate dehydratase small subunit [Thalassobacillus cyri]|uniref:(2R)-sulfolactate sulfo-lyase subunit alpha/altronate dehydratase small subunit n=1 Tax=Thalassobacillus cyri TaxID=571932 RepID=A0A1H4AHF5_9BACI|nr:UxaA family hydrolase [Thalassobacillus cyri]SEA35201.1 (2R)-sulfolactate sulfo-lyase subunit alpha/altronate dehydratase small subunit [Thalassobacillus cyri]
METATQTKKGALVIHPDDNVAVALSDLKKGEKCSVRLGESEQWVTALDDISFGHKLALCPIGKEESVLKYGEEIGKMSEVVKTGGWIHTHNLYCERGMK